LSDLNVQEKEVECQQTQTTRYEESFSARSDDNLHQRTSTQVIVNLQSLPASRRVKFDGKVPQSPGL